MTTMSIFIPVIAIGTCASVSDVRTGRIPNLLTFGASALALLFHFIDGGPSGLGWSAGGWAIGCALFLPFFLLGGMGAGDVKLLAAIGAWVGPSHAFWTWAYASVAGGVFAVAVSLARGYLRQALRNVWLLLCHWRVVGMRPLEEVTLVSKTAPRVAYALPIAVGAVLACLK